MERMTLLGTQRAPGLPLEVGRSECKRPETPCQGLLTPHPTSGPLGPAHTLGGGPRPQVRCLLPLTRPGRVDTSSGFWSCLEYPVCQACAPVATPLPPHLSMGKEDVLPLPVSCRLCGGAGAHLHSTVRGSPAPPSSQRPPRAAETGSHPTAPGPPAPPRPGISPLPFLPPFQAHRICPAWVLDTFQQPAPSNKKIENRLPVGRGQSVLFSAQPGGRPNQTGCVFCFSWGSLTPLPAPSTRRPRTRPFT